MKSRKSLAITHLLLNAAAISSLLTCSGVAEAADTHAACSSLTTVRSFKDTTITSVEAGQTPDTVVASREDGKLSRPLCAYPTLARYKGPGDPAEAANFECK